MDSLNPLRVTGHLAMVPFATLSWFDKPIRYAQKGGSRYFTGTGSSLLLIPVAKQIRLPPLAVKYSLRSHFIRRSYGNRAPPLDVGMTPLTTLTILQTWALIKPVVRHQYTTLRWCLEVQERNDEAVYRSYILNIEYRNWLTGRAFY